jgi:hypothetical protein
MPVDETRFVDESAAFNGRKNSLNDTLPLCARSKVLPRSLTREHT